MKLNIAVILPERYRGGTLRGAMNITRMLAIGARQSGDDLTLSFGHIDDPTLYADSDFKELRELGVRVRPFRFELLPATQLDPLYDSWLNVPTSKRSAEYVVFNDGMSNFEDADFWLIISDRLQACIPPHRPYAIVVYDYIQRYVPEIFGKTDVSAGNWLLFEKYAEVTRRASFVICTTRQTRTDCITYVGADHRKVIHFPQEFDPVGKIGDAIAIRKPKEKRSPYLIWTTNSTQHKNHLNVIEGLEQYFSRVPESTLEVRMTGVYTHLFDAKGKAGPHYSDPYAVTVRDAIARTKFLKNKLTILGEVSDSEYLAELQGASWLLHGALYDNGTYSIMEAAWFGVPAISSDYPAIRECCQNFGIEVALFDGYQPDELCRALVECLPKRAEWVCRLPPRDHLTSRTFAKVAPAYWDQFKQAYRELVAG